MSKWRTWTWPSFFVRWLTHKKWWFSIAMLVYQRVYRKMTIEFVDLPMTFSHGGSFHSYGKLPDLQRVAMADLIGAWLSRPGKHRKNDGKIHHHHAIHGKIHELSMMIFQFVMLNYQRVSPNLWALQVFLYSHPQKRWNVGLVMTLWKTPAAVPMNHKKNPLD